MEQWVIETVRTLEVDEKDKFEKAYGVVIETGALDLACKITFKYSDVLLSDEGGIGDNRALLLKNKAVEMVEKACEKLRDDLDTYVEEKALDFDEYSLRWTLVELEESFKEKDCRFWNWYPHVKLCYKSLMKKWGWFTSKWMPTSLSLMNIKEKREEEILMLEKAHQMLGEMEAANVDSIQQSTVGGSLSTLVDKLMTTIDKNCKKNMTITRDVIAEVASPLTGIPASCLLKFPRKPVEWLKPRILAKGLYGQEHVPSAISNALTSRSSSGSCPIGSLLFLDGSRQVWTQTAKALAKQLFDDKEERLEVFDLSKFSDPGSASRLIGSPPPSSSNLTEGELTLTKAVKSRPFIVLLFQNVDKAHCSVIDVLIEIISHGRVSNGQGSTTDFSKTLIIMTSHVMDVKIEWQRCTCRRLNRKVLLKDISLDPSTGQCICLDHLREVKSLFRHDLLENLDDVIIFKDFHIEENMASIRLLLRDIANSMTNNRPILYTSNAALRYIWRSLPADQDDWRFWLEENLVPSFSDMLLENEMCTIYIDALVGEQDLSFRLEKGAYPGQCKCFKQSMEHFRGARAVYLKEKERVNKIRLLRKTLFGLLDAEARADLGSVAAGTRVLVKTIADLNILPIDPFMPNVLKEGQGQGHLKLKEKLQDQPETNYKRRKGGVAGLRSRLTEGKRQHQAIDVVVEALENSLDMPNQPAKSFLFLGLTGAGEADLVRRLAELLLADDGMTLLIYIDLSKFTESDSLSRFLNEPSEPTGVHKQCGLSLLEAVSARPHSVLVFSKVEKAHLSIFSALVSILSRTKNSVDGGHTDFGKAVIIFASELGNQRILSRLGGYSSQECDLDGATEQEEKRGFRFELVLSVDEIIFFNPLAREQLLKVGRLCMRVGPHLDDPKFHNVFKHLFGMANNPVYIRKPNKPVDVSSFLSGWLTKEPVQGAVAEEEGVT